MKKLLCCLTLCFATLFLFSASLIAQDEPAAAAETPLAASDLDTFKAVMRNTIAAGADESKLQNVYKDAATANGTTEDRAAYVVTKISIIQAILSQPDSKDAILETLSGDLVPTDAEIELVGSNLAELYSVE